MQTKRLHISGLTPAISEQDIYSRFSVFGTVKAVNGFGQLNAVGQPRNFAFLSLEATPDKVSKCLNVLSGSTWKGTKLRIGDARPDFEQKLQMERIESPRPKKRRRLASGVESKDMSLVTLENVEDRAGWKKTGLSHLVRPVRMRPLHPIPPPGTSQASTSGKNKQKKASPLTRARRQKIDPTLYDRVHITEIMLQADHIVAPPTIVSKKPSPVKTPVTLLPANGHKIPSQEPSTVIVEDTIDSFQAEKQKDLGLLALLFEGKEKWEGKEDDLEGIDMDIVTAASDSESSSTGTSRIEQDDDEEVQQESKPSLLLQAPTTRLKDLFVSEPAEPVSILQGLDLDLEDDFAFDSMRHLEPPSEQKVIAQQPLIAEESQLRRKGLEPVQFSSTAPYFFPLLPHERSRGTVKDIMAVSTLNGWMKSLLHPITPEEARNQWETQKVALTRDWKQRHREASKKQRKGTAINDLE